MNTFKDVKKLNVTVKLKRDIEKKICMFNVYKIGNQIGFKTAKTNSYLYSCDSNKRIQHVIKNCRVLLGDYVNQIDVFGLQYFMTLFNGLSE